MAQKKTAKEYYQIVLYGGALIGIFLVGRALLRALNIVDTAAERRQKLAEAEALKKAQQQLKVKPTQTDYYWKTLADSIWTSINVCVGDDYDAAERYLKLVEYWGTRQLYCFGIPTTSGNLSTCVSDELPQTRINNINNYYASRGMKYRL
jgi:hypothetical protein